MPRSTKGRRTRARMLEAAKVIFERDGFLTARITDIAEAAGVSHGTFYHYFDSKEEIFREVAEQQEVSLLSMDYGHHQHFRDPIEGIRWANREYLTAYEESKAIMKVIEEVTRYDEAVREVRVNRQDRFAHRLEAAIVRMQEEGRADPGIDPWYAANALGGMVGKFAELWFLQGHHFDRDTAVDQLTLLWANALGLSKVASATEDERAGMSLDGPTAG